MHLKTTYNSLLGILLFNPAAHGISPRSSHSPEIAVYNQDTGLLIQLCRELPVSSIVPFPLHSKTYMYHHSPQAQDDFKYMLHLFFWLSKIWATWIILHIQKKKSKTQLVIIKRLISLKGHLPVSLLLAMQSTAKKVKWQIFFNLG